jgi:alkyl hydroperoxide reductase subunit AhpF
MNLIPDDRKDALRNDLNERMVDPVKIVMFTQEVECKFCSETRQLAQELAALNDKLSVEVYDFVANADKAKEYKVEKIPALVIIGKKDYGVRIYGIPYGYELQTLIGAVVNVSRGTTDVSENT